MGLCIQFSQHTVVDSGGFSGEFSRPVLVPGIQQRTKKTNFLAQTLRECLPKISIDHILWPSDSAFRNLSCRCTYR